MRLKALCSLPRTNRAVAAAEQFDVGVPASKLEEEHLKRFKNIVVVYADVVGSEDALLNATELAKRNRAQLTLVEVVAPRDSAHLEERRRRLERIALSVHLDGLPISAVVRQGTPFIEIIKLAMHIEADLVIAPAERTVGIRSLLIGNTSMRLIRKCPCPVWIIKPEQHSHCQRVLAAVDAASTDANELNVKILELASSLARRLGASLGIVYAWNLDGADAIAVRSEMRPDDRKDLIARHQN